MATRTDRTSSSGRASAASARAIGGELRIARLGAGLSQATVAASAGMSRAEYGRIERGFEATTIRELHAIAPALGLSASIRLFPAGDPLRDAAQGKLLGRLHDRLPHTLGWRLEVPMPIPGDRRAWDALILGAGWEEAVEAEAALHDAQTIQRKIELKRRDSGIDNVILLIADTRRNRQALEAAEHLLRPSFPLSTRTVLGALAAGRAPGGSGIVVL